MCLIVLFVFYVCDVLYIYCLRYDCLCLVNICLLSYIFLFSVLFGLWNSGLFGLLCFCLRVCAVLFMFTVN